MELLNPKHVSLLVGMTLFLMHTTECANIMFFAGLASYSPRVGMWPLAEKLSESGHAVTFVSPFEAKQPNPKIKDYVPKSLKTWIQLSNNTAQKFHGFKLDEHGHKMCNVILEDSEYLAWLETSKFDLMIIDALLNECAYGMAYKLNSKIILFSTADGLPWLMDPFGIPDQSSWIPDMIFHSSVQRSFWQRVKSAVLPIYFGYWRQGYLRKMEGILRDKWLPKMPCLAEIERERVSLLLINQHFAEDFARPFPPNVIPVGGITCFGNSDKMSKEMEDFAGQSGPLGFIYVSFGSRGEFSMLPEATQQVFINTFKTFQNISFIWKFNVDRPKDFPANVLTDANWMPQEAILSHPKIRAFITNSGLFGIQEAICHSVPLIALPMFAEQDYNANKIEAREIGIKLEITDITENKLGNAILEIIQEEKYSLNMKRSSSVFRDRPNKPLETAVWWTEYVLRNNDTFLLKPTSMYQSWWKKRQLDVWAFIFSGIVSSILAFLFICKFLFALAIRRKASGEKFKLL